MYFKSQAITCNKNTYAYRGFGYTYFLHRQTPQGTYAKLHIKRELFNAFRHTQEKTPRVFNKQGQQVECQMSPRIKDLQGIEIFATGGGWWTITVLDENLSALVSQFLARLNKWMLEQRRVIQNKALQFVTDNSLHKVYKVAVDAKGRPIQDNSLSPVPAKPQAIKEEPQQFTLPLGVLESKLQRLAATLNARFGH
jgi:hypothetical protein